MITYRHRQIASRDSHLGKPSRSCTHRQRRTCCFRLTLVILVKQLTGALSRFVNQLPDDAKLMTPQLQSTIRAVRANLKLAINESLTTNQTELVSSYLQIIIMSEGEKWIREQTQNVALALRMPAKEGRPVHTARDAVKTFATRELRTLDKGNAVASVEE